VLIPGIIGPIIGAGVLKNADVFINGDGTQSFIPNQNIFIAALVALVVTGIAVALVKLLIKKLNKQG
jgi:hypothetical protein